VEPPLGGEPREILAQEVAAHMLEAFGAPMGATTRMGDPVGYPAGDGDAGEAMNIYFDGACEPVNPGGHMGWGIAVMVDGAVVETQSGYQAPSPTTSNNVAEYLGACMALRRALEATRTPAPREIMIRGDSKLVIEQLNGRWKVRNGLYVPHYEQAKALLCELQLVPGLEVTLAWLPGAENVHADKASRAELEKRGIQRPTRQ
jgi:ribonuclease HI